MLELGVSLLCRWALRLLLVLVDLKHHLNLCPVQPLEGCDGYFNNLLQQTKQANQNKPPFSVQTENVMLS